MRWNERHAKCPPPSNAEPDAWLVEAVEAIETRSAAVELPRRAIDVACGLGHNAIWLAQQGWRVDGVDISANGLKLARELAAVSGVHVEWIEADLDDWTPPACAYELAIVFRFLDRNTVPRLVKTALRPGGWLIYETFSAAQCDRSDNHIGNRTFTLAPGELLDLFPGFDVYADREDALNDRTVERFLGRRKHGA